MLILGREIDQLWSAVDPRNLKGTLPKFKAAMTLLVQKYGKASMALASNYYMNERRAAGFTSRLKMALADPANLQQVSAGIDFATSTLWNVPPAGTTITDPRADEELVTAARTQVQGVAEKLVQDPARETTLNTIRRDEDAVGWARIPEPSLSKSGTCSFCALLATRGAVYGSEASADFKAHNGCKCHPQPLFRGQLYVPSSQVLDWQQTYAQASKGHSGASARAAFRQAIEGREVTGLTK